MIVTIMRHAVRGWSRCGQVAAAGFLVAAALLLTCAPVAADADRSAPSIFELTKPQVPNAIKGMSDSVREGILMPAPPAVQEWVLQPDGSMKNTRTGISMAIRNVCAPGDLDHEAALDAYRRVQARKTRSR